MKKKQSSRSKSSSTTKRINTVIFENSIKNDKYNVKNTFRIINDKNEPLLKQEIRIKEENDRNN